MTGFQSKRQASKEGTYPDPWRDAIDAELVCLHLGTADSFSDANEALDALINWHIATALDPAVSAAAQALIDRGAAVAEPLTDDELRECFTRTNTAEPLSEGWPGLERFARAIEAALQKQLNAAKLIIVDQDAILTAEIDRLRAVVEGAAAADEFQNSPEAIQRLAAMARAALGATK